MEKKKNSTVQMRFTVAIVFILFTYLYLEFFQEDVLAVAQHVLSGGLTTYGYTYSPILLTLVLFLLQVGVVSVTKVRKRFHALTYFPSMLILAALTDVPNDIDTRQGWGWWWLAIPLLLLAWAFVMWVARQVEPFDPALHRGGWLTKYTWQNLLQMLIMMMLCVFLSNNDRVFHERMKMERLMVEGQYEQALKVGYKSQDADSSLTMLRVACLHRCGSMGEHLFNYPLVGGSKAMVPDGVTVKAMMWQVPLWMKVMQDDRKAQSKALVKVKVKARSKVRYRIPTDYQLCGLLLDKKLDQFVVEVKRTYLADSLPLPTHYKEALVLYAHRRAHPMLVYRNDVMDADFQDYQALEHKYANPMEKQAALHDTYGNTYWYYYQYGNK